MSKVKLELKEEERALMTFELFEKVFKTGSRGFHAQGKVELDGKKYQCNFLLVEIGSKPLKEAE